ncbi:MAG: Maf family protein [Verrucomicrobia bacterium]|nr:Maf family protein [Verrucomicrobiota bacterium]MCF7708247.1 Maf family protein [Verrucomicrobiota bacterium]
MKHLYEHIPNVILASSSPRRRMLLKGLGLPFSIINPEVDEPEYSHLTPSELCRFVAFLKAKSVALAYPDSLVIGADTIVCRDNVIFGKPENLDHARSILSTLQGTYHHVITGVAVMRLSINFVSLFHTTTKVHFKSLSSCQINHYLDNIHYLDKAGAYAIQNNGSNIVSSIEGSYSNVVGLPIEELYELLYSLNLPISIPAS